jgi:guanine deaminase
MLRQGVTTASYYGSLHADATKVLAAACVKRGQRALIGKCNMDRNSPDYCRDESADMSLADTADCIQFIRAANPEGDLIRPVLTPRFAISCTPELLAGLGAMARADPSLAVQTHFTEAQQEVSTTLDLFPNFSNEADLYNYFGLLTPRTILAHCTLVTQYDLQVLQQQQCGIAHCPTANMTVGGGFMAAPVRQFLRCGIHVGLGTDCGGGYSSSMLDSMRHALIASNARAVQSRDVDAALTLDEVFHMATMGGANVVGWGHTIGNFQTGKQFDALLVDMRAERNGINTPVEEADLTRTIFEKYVMTGDDRNIAQVFVKGKMVHQSGAE